MLDALHRKLAGGPGSGDPADNSRFITANYTGLSVSPIISIGKRRAFMNTNKPYEEGKKIPLKDIKYVGQHRYVPKKLKKFVNNKDLLNIPIDVIIDNKNEYHVMDGHHRFLAALDTGKKSIMANIYKKSKLAKTAGILKDERSQQD